MGDPFYCFVDLDVDIGDLSCNAREPNCVIVDAGYSLVREFEY